MTNPTYNAGAVTVDTQPSLVCTVGNGLSALLQNTGDVTAYLGGPDVSASGANTGFPLPAGTSTTIPKPSADSAPVDLYAITASGTTTLSWLTP